MKIRVRGLRLSLDHKKNDIIEAAARRLNITTEAIKSLILIRKAIDARRKTVFYIYTVDLELEGSLQLAGEILESPEISLVEEKTVIMPARGDRNLTHAPLIVGSGPAGLFCALYLARNGYKPVVIEQGQDIDNRINSVEKFWRGDGLDTYSNTQYGEGGAGTFSDGKLTTRIGDERVDYVLKTFVEKGAAEEIIYLKKPHVGTDVIRQVVKNIRQEIIDLGGEFYFNTRMTDINVNKECLQSIIINNEHELACSVLVLAVGNSARAVYRMLEQKGIKISSKAFAVGVRIEHPQELIDRIQYGSFAGHPQLPAADYHLTYQDRKTGRSLYTFCMCPGGYVIAASSAPGQVVTNGMSYFKRDSGLANSALVATVSPADWANETMGGIKLQEELEQRAFKLGGGNYHAPAQYLKDFMENRASDSLADSIASYSPGVTPANLGSLFPAEIAEVIRRGIKSWSNRMDGFLCDEAVMTGVETRTSSPVRIDRDSSMCSVNLPGMYPCGEGAGYAGGIVSSAVDGLKVAEQIISVYKQPQIQTEIKMQDVVRGSSLK